MRGADNCPLEKHNPSGPMKQSALPPSSDHADRSPPFSVSHALWTSTLLTSHIMSTLKMMKLIFRAIRWLPGGHRASNHRPSYWTEVLMHIPLCFWSNSPKPHSPTASSSTEQFSKNSNSFQQMAVASVWVLTFAVLWQTDHSVNCFAIDTFEN